MRRERVTTRTNTMVHNLRTSTWRVVEQLVSDITSTVRRLDILPQVCFNPLSVRFSLDIFFPFIF